MEPSWTRNKAQGGFVKPVSENGSMEHFGLRLLGDKGHQRGFEKLGQNPSADQGVKENVEQREKWVRLQAQRDILPLQCRAGLPARSRWDCGIKAVRVSVWDLPAGRDQCARALLTIPLLSSSSLAWQLGRGEAVEGKI